MKQIKGAALLYFVKTIRADKSGVYNSYLTKEDLPIIQKKILPTLWYPYETFRRCLNAVFEVVGKKDYEKLKEWGSLYAEMIMTEMFKTTIKKNNPLEHMRRVPFYMEGFYNFGHTVSQVENPQRVFLQLSDYDSDFSLIYIIMEGWFKRIAELCGAKDVKCEMVDKSWVNKTNTTSYIVSWA